MTSKIKELERIDKIEANDFLKNVLFDYLDIHSYIDLIYGTRGQVPGFTKKNAYKAPDMLIKNIAKQRVKKLSKSTQFLVKYIFDITEDFVDLSFEEFYMKVNFDKKLNDGQKLALIFLLFNEEYQKYKEKIIENIKNNIPPLTSLITLDINEQLNTLLLLSNAETLINEINYENLLDLDEEWLQNDKETNLIKKLETISLPPPDSGYYLMLFKRNRQELDTLEEDLQSTIFQLIIGDLINLFKKQSDIFKEKLNNLIKEIEDYKKAHEKISDNINNQSDKIISLELQLKNYKKQLEELKQKKRELLRTSDKNKEKLKKLDEENERYKNNIENIRISYNDLKKKYDAINKKQNNLDGINLFKQEQLYFITKTDIDKYSIIFSEDQLINIKNEMDLLELLQATKKGAIYFLNVDGVSTKESFKLEQPLKNNGFTYRIISGGFENVIRKIIYYLEGELRYEVKEKY